MQVDMEVTVMILKGCVVRVMKTLVIASNQVSDTIQIGKQSNKSNPLPSYSIKFSKKILSLKDRQSRKQVMVSSILSKNKHWDDFQYIKLSHCLFLGRIEDTINCFRDLLTFTCVNSEALRILKDV